jgi:hypothetical protein
MVGGLFYPIPTAKGMSAGHRIFFDRGQENS